MRIHIHNSYLPMASITKCHAHSYKYKHIKHRERAREREREIKRENSIYTQHYLHTAHLHTKYIV